MEPLPAPLGNGSTTREDPLAVEPSAIEPNGDDELGLEDACGPDCELGALDPDEPSPCEACDEATLDSQRADDSELDSILDAEPPTEPAPRGDLELGPIQNINFKSAFKELDKLTDEFEPRQDSSQSHRDPYFGSQSRIDHHWTARNLAPVSYTHLTLPTICSV